MYEVNTEQYLKERMLSNTSTTGVDKSEGSFVHDAEAPVAGELSETYIQLDRVLALAFAQTSSGEYLDKRAAEFGIYRKQGFKACGNVTFTGTPGVVIPSGTLVHTADGLSFSTTQEGVIGSGATVSIPVEAETIGEAYNVPPDVLTVLPIQIQGVALVTNPLPMVDGAEIEDDASLQARLFYKARNPASSGNKAHYQIWATEVTGVGDAQVFPTWNGAGTVKVAIINDQMLPASSQLVEDVVTHIEAQRPIGATVTVVAAGGVNIELSVQVTLWDGYVLNDIKNAIRDKVVAYFQSIAFKETYVSHAYIGSLILSTTGVRDYTNLTLNGAGSNVTIPDGSVAVLVEPITVSP